MNPEIVEVVARALCEQAGYDPDSLEPGDDPYMNNTPVDDGRNRKGEICHFRWRCYYWPAQAALTAARPAIMEEAAVIMDERAKMYRAKAEKCDPLADGDYTQHELRIGHAEASEYGAAAIRAALRHD